MARKYRIGFYNSNSTDLGWGANRLYSRVMYTDDVREERKRIKEVLRRFDRKTRRFINGFIMYHLSVAQVGYRFGNLEEWVVQDRLDKIVSDITAMNLKPVHRYVRFPYGFSRGCTMKKAILHS